MRKYISRTLCIFSISLISISCHEVDCSNRGFTPVFIGFDTTDLRSLVVRAYKPDNNFDSLIDTVPIITPILSQVTKGDTTIVYILEEFENQPLLTFPFDWQISIPSKNITVNISQIVSPQNKIQCFGDCFCTNHIDSYILNGKQINPTDSAVSEYDEITPIYIFNK